MVEKSMRQKYKNGEITKKEYKDYCSIPKEKSMKQKVKDGEITEKEYKNWCAIRNGYKNNADYRAKSRYKKGISKPMSKNKSCASYLGVHIAERYLAFIFETSNRMPFGNHGFDFICGKGYKIDCKSSCLRGNDKNKGWNFRLNNNKIADYFICIGFNNIKRLKPMHIWLIKNTEEFKNKINISITNSSKSLKKWEKYEQTEKLNKLNNCLINSRKKENS